jgi:ATP-dependent Clp protease ATP-binding subunit ClpB
MNQNPAIVNLILSRSTAALNEPDSWDGSDDERASFASDKFSHRALRESTALHYACLLGDMEITEALLKQGAKWTIADDNNLLPEHCIDVSNGDDKKKEFKRLCEEELMRAKKREEEEELKQTNKPTDEEQLKLPKKPEDDEESEEEELKQAEKRAEDEELLKRRKRQSKFLYCSCLVSSGTLR